jgi:hypothetical protein
MKEYYYHVVYSFNNAIGTGTGKIDLIRTGKIQTFQDTKSVKEYIEEREGFESVVLINWIEMEGE